MNDKNVCPYCGGKVVAGFTEFRGVQGYQGYCGGCGAKGPVLIEAVDCWQNKVIHAFCHPAHLMKGKTLVGDGLRTYNPRTHIVVSREAGERVAKIIEYDVCGRENCKCGELAAELRAALEVGK